MIISDIEVSVFGHATRRHSDSAGHAHPGPVHTVEQAMLTIRTEDGHAGHSFKIWRIGSVAPPRS